MRYTLFLFALIFSAPSFAFDQKHELWSQVLGRYVDAKNMVKYQTLKSDLSKEKDHPLPMYLTQLEQVKLSEFNSWKKNEQMAFLINAYNAFTVKLIIDHYPVKSIKKIGGFFKKPWSIEFFALLDGQIKSLDPIEHEWLRPKYKDYRIHAAVNCASISCPVLRKEAFIGPELQRQLDEQMRLWIQDTSRNQVQMSARTMTLSKIFDWYKADFEAWGGGVIQVVGRYSTPTFSADKARDMKIKYLDYNWDLNEAK